MRDEGRGLSRGRGNPAPGGSNVQLCLGTSNRVAFSCAASAGTFPSSVQLSGQYITFKISLPFLGNVLWESPSFCLLTLSFTELWKVFKSGSFVQNNVLNNVFEVHAGP